MVDSRSWYVLYDNKFSFIYYIIQMCKNVMSGLVKLRKLLNMIKVDEC